MTTYLGAAVLGGGGGLLVELAFTSRFVKVYGQVPWSRKGKKRVRLVDGQITTFESWRVYVVSVALRTLLGAGAAMVLFMAGPLGPFSAVVGGIAAYALIDQWARGAELPDNRLLPTERIR